VTGKPTLIWKYITTLVVKNLADNNVPAWTELLKTTVDNLAAKQLDQDIIQAMLSAGKTFAHTSCLPISPNSMKLRQGTIFSNRS
jgi:hypothetical protein